MGTVINRKTYEGCINVRGVPGANACMYESTNSNDFFSQIEVGVKEVVEAFVENGYHTFSSCQGHRMGSLYCFVSIIDEKDTIEMIKGIIYYINQKYKLLNPILYVQYKYKNELDIYNEMFKAPFILKILIGRFDDAELERKKKLIINAFKECICEQLEYDDIYCCKLRDKNIYKRY